jgi:hypothetical protein
LVHRKDELFVEAALYGHPVIPRSAPDAVTYFGDAIGPEFP